MSRSCPFLRNPLRSSENLRTSPIPPKASALVHDDEGEDEDEDKDNDEDEDEDDDDDDNEDDEEDDDDDDDDALTAPALSSKHEQQAAVSGSPNMW